MDLELECFLAVVKLKKINAEIELKQYQYVMQFATPEMEVFDVLLNKIEELVKDVKFYEEKLKEI
jgi:hypothetical protein